MPLVVCMICGRRVVLAKRPKRVALLKCTRCGTKQARMIGKVKAWMDTEAEGLDGATVRHKVMAQLKWWATQKGFKPAWAAIKFEKIFGDRPNGEAKDEPEPVGDGVMRIIRREAAAYAKEMRARGILFKRQPASRAGDGLDNPTLVDRANSNPQHAADLASPPAYESTLMSQEDWDAL